MEDLFEIFEFRFVDKRTKAGAVIYARTEQTALKTLKSGMICKIFIIG